MTRKDYILLAKTLRHTWHQSGDQAKYGVERAIRNISEALEEDSSRFDPEHFLAVVRGEKDLNSKPSKIVKAVKPIINPASL
jgi:hypothetical protein